jgi:cytochrome c peroxidase
MGWHQLGRELSSADRLAIIAFLQSLTGRVDQKYIAKPPLPESGPTTPAPDPT